MDRNEQQTIQELFEQLANVERQSPARDAEAEAYIREQIARLPGAAYYMAQTIVMQGRALDDAQTRIDELERQVAPQQSSGGLFSGIFGDSRQPSRSAGSVPHVGGPAPTAPQQPWGQTTQPPPQPGGGGFLAGAAQAAMGVAGGVLLGNAIEGMFGRGEAAAAHPGEAAAAHPQANDSGVQNASSNDAGSGGHDSGAAEPPADDSKADNTDFDDSDDDDSGDLLDV
jgi:hypothetical protein